MTKDQIVKLLALKVRLEHFVAEPGDLHYAEAISCLKKLRLTDINEFCLNHPTIRKILALPAFDAFWLAHREAIHLKSIPEFRFKRSSRLSDMEFSLGYVNYYLSLREPEKKEHYLQRAFKLHSFHAFNIQARECLMQMASQEHDEEAFFELLDLLPVFENEAPWLGTPAYLMTANLYYRAALCLIERNKTFEASAAFQTVIKHLYLAAQFEAESSHDIHNAYFAGGLAQSNPFKLATIAEMIDACIGKAGKYLDTNAINIAKNAAKLISLPARKFSSDNPESLSAIQKAILNDAPELIQFVLLENERLEKKSTLSDEDLLFAVRYGKINCVRYLLSAGLSPLAVDEDKNTSLHLAAITKNPGIYRLLHAASSEPEVMTNVFQLTPIDILKETHQDELIVPPKQLQSRLTSAILTGAMNEVEECLRQGALPDVLLPSGLSLLGQMMSTLNIKGIKLLTNAGASLNFNGAQGELPFFHLLKKDCSVHERDNRHIYFRHLISLGMNINQQNNAGETLLIQAVQREDYSSVLFLLDQDGVDVNITDSHGLNALDYAKKASDSKIAHYFDWKGFNKDLLQKEQVNLSSSKWLNKEQRFFKTNESVSVVPECVTRTQELR